jgi:prephenate dehydratase
MLRIGFLGPEGTFSHQALRDARSPAGSDVVPVATLYDTVMAVHDGDVDLALVPIENALEGSVDVTLDTLASDAETVTIVGEHVQRIRNCLIAAALIDLADIRTVYSHPQATGQCARFLRTELPSAAVLAASSTAEAVRAVATADAPGQAALGNRLAAELYGAHILREDVDDEDDNVTRFVWLARSERASELRGLVERGESFKTSIVFWGDGDEAPGWLVSCLAELSERNISLTRIESRPRRVGLGHYMFFADLEGAAAAAPLTAAIDGLRGRCQEVRLLGSYRAA